MTRQTVQLQTLEAAMTMDPNSTGFVNIILHLLPFYAILRQTEEMNDVHFSIIMHLQVADHRLC